MLGLRDTWVLATTKLRVRRVRLVVTLIVSGILFTTLVFGSLIIRGTLASLRTFTGEGLLNSYIVSVFSPPSDYSIYQDKTFIARVEQLDKARLDAQVAEAKRVGLPFDPKAVPKAVNVVDSPTGKEKVADNSQPATQQALAEQKLDTSDQELRKAASTYRPQAFYESFRFSTGGGTNEFTPIVSGQEQELAPLGSSYGLRDSLASFQNDLVAYDDNLLKPFLLEGADLATKPGEPVPILAPIDAVEKLVGLAPLSRKAKPQERVTRLAEVRSRAKDLILETCYRNKTAMDLRNQAKQQAAEIKAQAAEPGYVKPELIYGAPKSACQPTPVVSDTRTAAEKTLAEKQMAFDEKFGTPRPVTTVVKFRIVGVLPQLGSIYSATGPEAILTSFFTSTLGEGWFVSRTASLQNPILSDIVKTSADSAFSSKSLFVEFGSRDDQKRFIEEKSCDLNTDPKDCSRDGKIMASPFGNPLATLRDLDSGFKKFLGYVLLIIATLSAIVLMGTIGKIIADSRKETSVFRAVGAKRMDIAQIYLLYTAILATMAYGVALAIGLVAAGFIEAHFSPGLSVQAVLAFNSADLTRKFHLVGLNAGDLAAIYGFVMAVALVSATIPLLGNSRRNPVKDMRED